MLVLLLALLVVLPPLVADGLTNAGSLTFARATLLLDTDASEGQHAARLLEEARARFEQALALSGDHAAARWGLARASLALGRLGVEADENAVTAASALRPLAVEGTRNPLLYQDALTAFSYGGRPEEVIKLYESGLPLKRTQSVSDTVALAYLQRSAPGDLPRARTLRPGDLYANYHLWMQARQDGDLGAAAVYSETLTYFPLEAVHPADERLLDYAAEAIPSLLEEGLWDRDKTLNVASFLVWQHHGAAGVEQLLEQLIERYPTDPDWPFYLAELYHRRGDLDRAEAAYRQVLALDQNYAPAYLRIGMLYEARAEEEMGK